MKFHEKNKNRKTVVRKEEMKKTTKKTQFCFGKFQSE